MAKRRRSVLATAASVAGTALAGCLDGNGGNGGGNRSNRSGSDVNGVPDTPPTVEGTFPQFQSDAANTGAVPDGSGPTGAISSLFEFGTMGSDRRLGSPSVAAGTVYVTATPTDAGGSTGTSDAAETVVSAVDAVSGATLWETTYTATGDPGGTAVNDDTVLAPVGGRVVALDAASGDQRWSYACGLESGITVADGTAYVVGTQRGTATLYALSAADGTVRWEIAVDAETHYTTPAVADGTVAVGGTALQAFDTADGSQQWRADTAVSTPPVVLDDAVVVGSTAALRVYDTDGSERWTADLAGESAVTQPPAVTDGTVYLSRDGSLLAYDLEGGERTYSVALGIDGTPVVVDGYVYLFGRGQLTCLRAEDGATEWSYGTQQRTDTAGVAPAVVDGMAYFPAERLYAISE